MTDLTATLRNLAAFRDAINAAPTDAALNELIDAVTGKDQVSIGFARDLGSDHIVNLGDGITIALGAETPDGRDLLA